MLCGLECLISPNVDDDRRSRRTQNLGSSEIEVVAGIALPFKVSNMIGTENGRIQIIYIRTGMKEIDNGSPSLAALRALETAVRALSFTAAVESSMSSFHSCKEVGEIDEIFVLHRIDDFRHLRVVPSPRIVLVSA